MKEEWAKDSIYANYHARTPKRITKSAIKKLLLRHCFIQRIVVDDWNPGRATMEPGRHPSCWNAVAPHNDPLASERISWAESLSI